MPHFRHYLSEKTAGYHNHELGPRWCDQLGHVHGVVWLHDTICEAAATDEPGTGNYVTSGVPYVPVVIPLWSK